MSTLCDIVEVVLLIHDISEQTRRDNGKHAEGQTRWRNFPHFPLQPAKNLTFRR